MLSQLRITLQLLNSLTPELKKEARLIPGLLILTILLDLFTLASIYPLILLILNQQESLNFSGVSHIKNISLYGKEIIIATIVVVLILLLLKNYFVIKINSFKTQYALKVSHALSRLALKNLLNKSYQEYASTDFTKELNRIAHIPFHLTNDIILPIFHIIPEIVLLLFIMCLITLLNTYALLILIPLIITAFLLYRFKKKEFKKINEQIKLFYPLHLKKIGQLLDGFVEVIVLGKEDAFVTKILFINKSLGKQYASQHTIQYASARITESLAIILLCLVLLTGLLFNFSQNTLLELIGLFGIASFKALPALTSIFTGLTQLKTHQYVFEEVSNIISPQPKIAVHPPTFSFKEKIILQQVSFSYSKTSSILNDLTFSIPKGKFIGIGGPSGAGKTTLLLLIAGFLKPLNGEIRCDNITLDPATIKPWQHCLGYVSQNPVLLDGTVLNNILLDDDVHHANIARVQEILNSLELHKFVNQLVNGIHTDIGEHGIKISGGQRQRIALARALYANREILLLDEPTNQLDKDTEENIMTILRRLADAGKTIIMITHNPANYSYFDYAYILEKGNLSLKS